MVTINSRDFGTIEVSEENIFDFPNGIFAFEDTRQFALISPLGEDVYPMWLQSTESTTPCFIVFDPLTIDANYKITLNQSERTLLKLENENDARLLAIAKVPEDYRDTTVNMKSPIIINTTERLAAQVILPYEYPFRLPIYKGVNAEAGA